MLATVIQPSPQLQAATHALFMRILWVCGGLGIALFVAIALFEALLEWIKRRLRR